MKAVDTKSFIAFITRIKQVKGIATDEPIDCAINKFLDIPLNCTLTTQYILCYAKEWQYDEMISGSMPTLRDVLYAFLWEKITG